MPLGVNVSIAVSHCDTLTKRMLTSPMIIKPITRVEITQISKRFEDLCIIF